MRRKRELPDALAVIHNRRSVREYTNQAIGKEDLLTILRAGMAAPTAVNLQPWSFVTVTERAVLDRLGDGLPYAKMLGGAEAAIVVCAIPKKAYEQKVEFAVIDSACASQNILLAVESLGLGAVWTAVYPYSHRMDLVRRTLNIPDNIIPLNVIPIGHPAGAGKPINKFIQENIHWEKW